MRVVSMVPSWTETLIEAGIEVVGRTRYCVHPADQVDRIPVVGGTKDIKWDLVEDLKPDLILLDQEENPREMADEAPIPFLATHVASIQDLRREFERLGDFFKNSFLIECAIRCEDLLRNRPPPGRWRERIGGQSGIGWPLKDNQKIIYMIWRKPWMAVTKETYIGSVLTYLGAELENFGESETPYPVVQIENHSDCYFLFSSEPYPFEKKRAELEKMSLNGAFVDGENYSWFGVRGLRFLESCSEIQI